MQWTTHAYWVACVWRHTFSYVELRERRGAGMGGGLGPGGGAGGAGEVVAVALQQQLHQREAVVEDTVKCVVGVCVSFVGKVGVCV